MNLLIIAAAVLLPQDPPADAWFAWHGFGVGSRAVIRKSDIGGAEAPVKTYRKSVTAIEDGWPKVEIEVREGDAKEWDSVGKERVPYAGKTAAERGYAAKASSTGEVQIDGKAVAVAITAWTKGETTLELTRAAGLALPLRDLGSPDGTITLPADTVAWKLVSGVQTIEMRVVATAEKRKVGEREIPCLVEEGIVTQRHGDLVIRGKTKIWSSASVPGRKVRSETENDIKGKISGSIEELVEFEAKPAK